MQYINQNRKIGLSGLMRVMNDAQTLAQSIDSCVNALDELIITYNDCTDDSPLIIEQKKRQYPDKIQVIPYPYHVMGINLTDEDYKKVKSLPVDSPHLLASYYNNALKHLNYKYVVKIDADQIYFEDKLRDLRNRIVTGVKQNIIEKTLGRVVFEMFANRKTSKRLWSKWHIRHYLQYLLVPYCKKQYISYAISQFVEGNMYLSLSGVNALCYKTNWYTPVGCKSKSGVWWPYNGEDDTLVFRATEETYYVPFDMSSYQTADGKRSYIEKFVYPKNNKIASIGCIWFHLKCMQSPLYEELLDYAKYDSGSMLNIEKLSHVPFSYILSKVDNNLSRKGQFNFIHNLDRKIIPQYIGVLDKCK